MTKNAHLGHLPLLPYPREADDFLYRHEIADQLERYADIFQLGAYPSCTVRHLSFDESRSKWSVSVCYNITGEMREYTALHVVWATGGGGRVPRYPNFRNRVGLVYIVSSP